MGKNWIWFKFYSYLFLILGSCLLITGCATVNPNVVISNFKQNKIYPPIRLTQNTEASLKVLTDQFNLCNSINFGSGSDDVKPQIITDGVQHVLSQRFMQIGDETNNNLIMLFDVRIKLGPFSWTKTTLDLTGTFMDGDQTVDSISAHGQAVVPYPASNRGFQKAANQAFEQFDNQIKLSEKLAAYFAFVFEQKTKAWLSLPQKPPLPEEARRYRVLADDAVAAQQFDKAAGYYEQGLAVYPTWPTAQYNVAVIYAQLKEYPMAVMHMKRYLILKPQASDARDAQDKIYIWEEKTQEGQQ